MTQRWIDTHVHLFSERDSDKSRALPYAKTGALNTAAVYLEALDGDVPEGVVVVDFSMAPSSEHVVNSLDELKAKGIPAAGVINANPDEPRTFEWMQRSDVKAVRVYAKTSIPNFAGNKAGWQRVFDTVKKRGLHILVFGEGEFLRETIKQLPEEIPVLIDHLGVPNLAKGADDAEFQALLAQAKARKGKVYFKGPGYRTSLNPAKVQPFVNAILKTLGADRLMLGASDGPFAGPVTDPNPKYQGKKHAEVLDYDAVLSFVTTLAKQAANDLKKDSKALTDQLLYGNAKQLYGF